MELFSDYCFSSSDKLKRDEEDEIARQLIRILDEKRNHYDREDHDENQCYDGIEDETRMKVTNEVEDW